MEIFSFIKKSFELDKVFYTSHAKNEMENEEFGIIYDKDIYEAIVNGEIIEEYPEDRPYPSCLIYGRTENNRHLHVVCAYDRQEKITFVITAYQPNSELWMDYKWRRK